MTGECRHRMAVFRTFEATQDELTRHVSIGVENGIHTVAEAARYSKAQELAAAR